jgi:hypothetical protein
MACAKVYSTFAQATFTKIKTLNQIELSKTPNFWRAKSGKKEKTLNQAKQRHNKTDFSERNTEIGTKYEDKRLSSATD